MAGTLRLEDELLVDDEYYQGDERFHDLCQHQVEVEVDREGNCKIVVELHMGLQLNIFDYIKIDDWIILTFPYHIPVLNYYCLDEVVKEMDMVVVHVIEVHK